MTVAVLAVQGAFAEHEQMLNRLGAACIQLRKKQDLDRDFQALILPGGESTVQGKLLRELGLYEELRQRIENGMPVLGTCAGLVLLASELSNDQSVHFGTLPVTVRRNAYGRQLASFYTEAECRGIGTIPMTFIRAPYIEKAGEGVEVLAQVDGNIVAVRYQNQIGVAFHPELGEHTGIHRMLLEMIS